MKPIRILIPCWNEAQTIGATIKELPTQVAGHPVEVWVADDGSSDQSVLESQQAGARVLPGPRRGLARTVARSLPPLAPGSACVVILDADGQYDPAGLSALCTPVLRGEPLSIGSRPDWHRNRPWWHRALYLAGRLATAAVTRQWINDPVSGYRAYRPDVAASLNLKGTHTYTLESLVQFSRMGWRAQEVPIAARATTRPSRLIRSVPGYCLRQARTLWHARQWHARPRKSSVAPALARKSA